MYSFVYLCVVYSVFLFFCRNRLCALAHCERARDDAPVVVLCMQIYIDIESISRRFVAFFCSSASVFLFLFLSALALGLRSSLLFPLRTQSIATEPPHKVLAVTCQNHAVGMVPTVALTHTHTHTGIAACRAVP